MSRALEKDSTAKVWMLQSFASPVQVSVALKTGEECDNGFCSGAGVI